MVEVKGGRRGAVQEQPSPGRARPWSEGNTRQSGEAGDECGCTATSVQPASPAWPGPAWRQGWAVAVAGARTAPPSRGELALEVEDREARVSPSERAQRQADLAWAATVERQQALAERAPAASTAWQLVRGLKLPALPLHPTTLAPIGEAITDPLAVLEHWQGHPDHAVGIRLGAHRGGTVALVGVQAGTWAAWRGWLRANAVDERVRPWSDEDLARGELEQVGRPLGGPLIVRWQDPPRPVMRSVTSKGNRQMNEGAEWLRRVNQGTDRGGWLVWTVPAVGGRLPGLKHRQLAAGLAVLGTDEVVPLWAASSDGFVLRQDGSVRQANPVTDCPPWLLESFGAKWAAGA